MSKQPTTALLVNDLETVAETMRMLLSQGLTEDALVILVSEYTKVNRTQVREVIRCLPNLDKIYIKKGKS